LERETIAARTRDKIAAARRKGRWTGGFLPLGYDLVDGKLVVNEAEALQVQATFDLYLAQGSLTTTLRELRKRGWTMKRWTTRAGKESGGDPFSRSALHTLLTSVIYLGQVALDGEAFPGEHPAIVEQDVWDDVQRRLRSNGFKRSATTRNAHGAFLKGILYCAACDARMVHTVTRKGGRGYRYYVCGNAQRDGWHKCPVKSVAAGTIEAAVLQEIREAVQAPQLIDAAWTEVQRHRRERIRELEREVRIEEANGNGRLGRVRAELATLQRMDVDRNDLAQAIDDFTLLWDALSYAEQAGLAASLLDRVDYDGSEITLHFGENCRG
jgi:site-specific DNA recombinase